MRGPKPAYPSVLTVEEVKHLQHLIRAHTTPQALAVRAQIILRAKAHPEQSNQQIASVVGTTDRTVRAWRGRWVKTHSLADAPRSGRRVVFPPQVRAQVTALACSLPRQQQVPLSRWSRPNWLVGWPKIRPAAHLAQHGGALAQSRTPAPLALSRLAAHP